MMKYNVRSAEDALAYLLDCSLATVCDLAMKKSKSKSEYSRQISIAQINYDWCVNFGARFEKTRGQEVLEENEGSVEKWAKKYESSPAKESK